MQKVSKNKTASSYALAWYEVAKENKCEDVVLSEVLNLQASISADGLLWKVLSRPSDCNNSSKVIKELSKKIQLSSFSTETLLLIAENGRLDLLDLILKKFIEAYQADKNIVEVTVDTVVSLTATQNNKLKKILEDKLKAQVILNYRINPDILGGLAIRFKSFQIDDTISGKLKRIKQQILDNNSGL